MTEIELLFQVSHIVNGRVTYPQAVEQIDRLLRSQTGLPPRIETFISQQLSLLLARTELAERRAALKREISEMEEDLATRKVVQRAEGILVAKRGMSLAAAKRWIV